MAAEFELMALLSQLSTKGSLRAHYLMQLISTPYTSSLLHYIKLK